MLVREKCQGFVDVLRHLFAPNVRQGNSPHFQLAGSIDVLRLVASDHYLQFFERQGGNYLKRIACTCRALRTDLRYFTPWHRFHNLVVKRKRDQATVRKLCWAWNWIPQSPTRVVIERAMNQASLRMNRLTRQDDEDEPVFGRLRCSNMDFPWDRPPSHQQFKDMILRHNNITYQVPVKGRFPEFVCGTPSERSGRFRSGSASSSASIPGGWALSCLGVTCSACGEPVAQEDAEKDDGRNAVMRCFECGSNFYFHKSCLESVSCPMCQKRQVSDEVV